jgi:subfamily B ATP-binding cassette protein MsbA
MALITRLYRDHIRRHLGRLGGAVLLMAVAAAGTAANAWLMEPVLDEVFVNQNEAMLVTVTIAVVLIAVVKAVATYGQAVLMNGVGQRIIADTQVDLFAHLMRADLSYFHNRGSGPLVSHFLYDSNLLSEAVSRAFTGIAKDSVTFAFLIALMIYQDWQLALATLVVLPPVAYAIRRLGKRMRKASRNMQAETGTLSGLLSETFDGVRMVKAYGAEARETGRARDVIERRMGYILKVIRTRAAATPITEMLASIAVGIVIFYGGYQVIAGTTTPGTFFSFMTALLLAYQPLKSLANLNAALQEGLAAAERIFAVLDVTPDIEEVPDATELVLSGGGIRLEAVRFAYGKGAPALDGVDLEVPAGRSVALVGPSGAGKSTLMNLIPRFYDPDEGRVLIDEQDVRGLTLASLRGAIGLVSQETALFDDTVRANIAYGRPGADEDAIRAAARDAAAHDFIEALPAGFDTVIGENGVKLSGGQRQRLAVARAMLKDPPILLLDEATSALDAEAERQVQTALRRLMAGRTTLVIAHRLSTVLDADRIYFVEDGRVVEAGSHQELIARGGHYARHHALQFSDGAPEPQAVGARA